MSICEEKGHLPKHKWYLSRVEGVQMTFFISPVSSFFFKHVFAVSICILIIKQ